MLAAVLTRRHEFQGLTGPWVGDEGASELLRRAQREGVTGGSQIPECQPCLATSNRQPEEREQVGCVTGTTAEADPMTGATEGCEPVETADAPDNSSKGKSPMVWRNLEGGGSRQHPTALTP